MWARMWSNRLLAAGRNAEMVQPLPETGWQLLAIANILPAVMLFAVYFKEQKTCSHRNLHTDVYSSFVCNCQHLNSIKMFLGKGRIYRLQDIQVVDFYSVPEGNELSSYERTQGERPVNAAE